MCDNNKISSVFNTLNLITKQITNYKPEEKKKISIKSVFEIALIIAWQQQQKSNHIILIKSIDRKKNTEFCPIKC